MSTGELELDPAAAARHLWYGERQARTCAETAFYWKVAKVIASSDGALNDEERTALLGRMSSTGTPPAVVEEVMAWNATAGVPSDILEHMMLPDDARRELGIGIVYEGLSIGFADGSLAPEERNSARLVAEVMGISSYTVEALVALCRDEALLRLRRVKTLKGLIAIAASSHVSPLAYELVPETVRSDGLRR